MSRIILRHRFSLISFHSQPIIKESNRNVVRWLDEHHSEIPPYLFLELRADFPFGHLVVVSEPSQSKASSPTHTHLEERITRRRFKEDQHGEWMNIVINQSINQWINGVFASATRDDVQNRLLVPIAWHQSGYRLFDFYFSWLAALWFENLKIATIATEDGKHQFVLSIFMILIDIHWPPWLFGERGLMLTLASLKEQCCPFRSFGSGVVESLGLAVELIW